MNETLLDLLVDLPHWEFEIITEIVINGVIIGLLWPVVKHLRKDHKEFHKSNG